MPDKFCRSSTSLHSIYKIEDYDMIPLVLVSLTTLNSSAAIIRGVDRLIRLLPAIIPVLVSIVIFYYMPWLPSRIRRPICSNTQHRILEVGTNNEMSHTIRILLLRVMGRG